MKGPKIVGIINRKLRVALTLLIQYDEKYFLASAKAIDYYLRTDKRYRRSPATLTDDLKYDFGGKVVVSPKSKIDVAAERYRKGYRSDST